jgi:hypothetical protein
MKQLIETVKINRTKIIDQVIWYPNDNAKGRMFLSKYRTFTEDCKYGSFLILKNKLFITDSQPIKGLYHPRPRDYGDSSSRENYP